VAFRALVLLLLASPAAAVEFAADYPEGPLWHEGRLFYGEMTRDRVMVSDLRGTVLFWQFPGCGPVSLAPYRGEELLVLCHLSHKLARLSPKGALLALIDRDAEGAPFIHPNDSSADGEGGVYLTASGEFSLAAPATGAVLHLARGGMLGRVAQGLRYANGIAVDRPHRRVLVSEHLNRRVLAFPLADDGGLGAPSLFFDLARLPPLPGLDPLAGPDGLDLDADGRLFIAEYGAGRIHLVDGDGHWLGSLTGLLRYVTDLALLPGDRAAVTEARVNDRPPFSGDVRILDRFAERFQRN
jgi:sugar lactone lactonase YvrE